MINLADKISYKADEFNDFATERIWTTILFFPLVLFCLLAEDAQYEDSEIDKWILIFVASLLFIPGCGLWALTMILLLCIPISLIGGLIVWIGIL